MKVLPPWGHSAPWTVTDRVQGVENTADLGLLRKASAGDQQALSGLFHAHVGFVRSVARNLGTPDAELDDVTQEAFVVAFRRLPQFQTGKLTTWLYRIVANLVANRHRARRVREAFATLLGRSAVRLSPGVDEAFERAETRVQIAQILARLPHKKREVFALYELEGLSGEEIAERVGCSVDTVWSRLHYARRDFEQLARKRGLR